METEESIDIRIERALERTRPALRLDGGDVRLVRMRGDGTLEIQWLGACLNCPMSVMTLRAGIERIVMKDVPEVRRVEAVRPP